MLEITNNELTATLLDPVDDRDRLGPRYCWGGYLYQLRDSEGRELFSGPEYPDRPTVFNGQGAPEVFCYQNYRTGAPINMNDNRGIILGIGSFDAIEDEPVLQDLCEWQCDVRDSSCTMTTEHAAYGWSYGLERTWELQGRTAISSSCVENRGDKPLEVLWFPHPFFPLVDGGMEFQINLPLDMEENPGFRKEGDRISMIPDFDWVTGRLEWLQGDFAGPLEAVWQHPVTGTVTMAADIAIAHLPLWANAHTISLEPYSYYQLEPGDSCKWSIRYRFDQE